MKIFAILGFWIILLLSVAGGVSALENGKPSEGWDGRNSKGEEMAQGMYVWRAEAIFLNDDVWTGGIT